MIVQKVDIPTADWVVTICYDARSKNTDSIIGALYSLDCPVRSLYKAERLLSSGVPNEGLTYSNKKSRESLIVIGHVTDVFQYINSLTHEKQHLEQAICNADGLDPYGEEIAYISGDISQAIARNAWGSMRKLFLFLV